MKVTEMSIGGLVATLANKIIALQGLTEGNCGKDIWDADGNVVRRILSNADNLLSYANGLMARRRR